MNHLQGSVNDKSITPQHKNYFTLHTIPVKETFTGILFISAK